MEIEEESIASDSLSSMEQQPLPDKHAGVAAGASEVGIRAAVVEPEASGTSER